MPSAALPPRASSAARRRSAMATAARWHVADVVVFEPRHGVARLHVSPGVHDRLPERSAPPSAPPTPSPSRTARGRAVEPWQLARTRLGVRLEDRDAVPPLHQLHGGGVARVHLDRAPALAPNGDEIDAADPREIERRGRRVCEPPRLWPVA